MLFNSQEFLFAFLPLVVLGFYFLGRISHRVSLFWLFGASMVFYGWWNPAYLALILLSIIVNFSLSRHLISDRPHRKTVLITGITFNLCLLGYFKYANFFVESISLASDISFNLEHIVLPLAISFFTFQQIAYLVDSWRGEVKKSDLLEYGIFVSFFPQLIAGPIVHHKEMMPQFSHTHKSRQSWGKVSIGITIFSMGLFKKSVIADGLSPIAGAVFSKAEKHATEIVSTIEAWTGMLAYTFQLYFDFSGYSDMAIGLALMFGIMLPINFRSPYKSSNIIEFWRRWHITLSRFLKTYLYIPLGGNRKGTLRKYVNLLITMLLGGLWHGAGVNFIIWGGLHGIYLTTNHIYHKRCSFLKFFTQIKFFSILLTFLCVAIAWVFFRAETLQGAITILSALIPHSGPVVPDFHLKYVFTHGDQKMWITLLLFGLAILLSFKAPNTAEYFFDKNKRVSFSPNMNNVIIILLCWACIIFKIGGDSEFLYFQF